MLILPLMLLRTTGVFRVLFCTTVQNTTFKVFLTEYKAVEAETATCEPYGYFTQSSISWVSMQEHQSHHHTMPSHLCLVQHKVWGKERETDGRPRGDGYFG